MTCAPCSPVTTKNIIADPDENIDQYRCWYSQHWTTKNTLPASTITPIQSWILPSINVAWLFITTTASNPVMKSRSVLASVNAFWNTNPLFIAVPSTVTCWSTPTVTVLLLLIDTRSSITTHNAHPNTATSDTITNATALDTATDAPTSLLPLLISTLFSFTHNRMPNNAMLSM